jgi:signal transduction histidine kinase
VRLLQGDALQAESLPEVRSGRHDDQEGLKPPMRRVAAGNSLRSVLAIPVFLVLAVASAGIVSATFLAGQAMRSLADQSLESTAVGISRAAGRVLREGGIAGVELRGLFADRVVAYALLADSDGTIAFHTNPDLRGTVLDDRGALGLIAGGAASGRRGALGTGRPVWIHDHALRTSDGRAVLLRVALQTADADRMLARIDRLWWSVGAVLATLWAGGLLLVLFAARADRLQREYERRQNLSLIGQMTATLAHEIRNAIGSVKGYAQLAAEKTAPGDPRAGNLAAVLQGVARIESLVGDLLRYSRDERFQIADVDPAPLIRAAGPPSDWRGQVELALEPGLRALADREKLEAVLANAVANAVESMGGAGLLRLGLHRRGDLVALTVEDSGGGIPAAALPKLFTPFYTTKTTGTGLGLAYAKKVVEGMGGTIDLTNRGDEAGAILTVLLPRARG